MQSVLRMGPLERDQFIAAVVTSDPSALDVEWERDADDVVRAANLLLVGEMHGTVENARLIAHLVERFGFQQLALEWNRQWTPALEGWLKGGPLPFDEVRGEDGRVTAGHFAVIKRLMGEGRLTRLVAFDGMPGEADGHWNRRDRGMADSFFEQADPALKTVLFAGNMHTNVEALTGRDPNRGGPGQGTLYPMGYHVRQRHPESVVARLEFSGGSIWNFGKRDLPSIRRSRERPAATLRDGNLVISLAEAHPAAVPKAS